MYGQSDSYSKIIDLNENQNELGSAIVLDSTSIYGIAVTYCEDVNQECLMVYKTDFQSNIIWKKKFNWTTRGNEDCIKLLNGKIYISNHDSWNDNEWNYHLIILNTDGDSVNHVKFNHNDKFIRGLANQGLTILDENIYLYGGGRIDTNLVSGFVHKYSFEDSSSNYKFIYEFESEWNFLSEMKRYSDTSFVFSLLSHYNNPIYFQRRIFEISTNLDIDLLWSSDSNLAVDKISDNIDVFQNGDILVMDVIDDFSNSFPHNLKRISKTGEIIWNYKWPDIWFGNELIELDIKDIQITESNKIIGCGKYSEFNNELSSWVNFGYLFCMTENGIMKWEYSYPLIIDGQYINSFLRDLKSLSDESIIAVGQTSSQDGTEKNTWHLRVDKNGCVLESNCNEFIQLLTSSEEPIISKECIEVFPNPIEKVLNVKFTKNGEFVIFNSLGEFVYSKSINIEESNILQLDATILGAPGVYYCRYRYNENGKLHQNIIPISKM